MMGSIRRPDDILAGWLAITAMALIVVGWVVGVALTYDMSAENAPRIIFYAAKGTPITPVLWIGPVLGLVVGIAAYAIGFNRWRTNFSGAAFVSRLRGPKMVSQWMYRSLTKNGQNQLVLASIPVPRKAEGTHFMVAGSTGTGKSVTIGGLIDSAQTRSDRIICIDPNGGFMEKHFREGDVILNPFDARTRGWSIFNEIRADFDCDQYAMAMIPRSPSTDQEQWNSMARMIVTETLATLLRNGEGTTERLLYWLTQAPNEDLQRLLQSTPAAGCFHGAEETLASIRTVLTRYVTPHKYLPAGDFSIRQWLESGTGNLWVTWREDMLESLKPLISCWTDVVCAAGLSLPEDESRSILLVVDELDSLEKLNYMKAAATKGRKHGFCIVAGLQSLAQLKDVYGEEDAMTLRNCFRTVALFGIATLDTYTAEEFSKGIGEHHVVRRRVSSTGGKATHASQVDHERIVSATEFHELKDLTGYVKFPGDMPVCKVKLQRKERPTLVDGLVMSRVFSEPMTQRDRLFSLRA